MALNKGAKLGGFINVLVKGDLTKYNLQGDDLVFQNGVQAILVVELKMCS